MIKFYDILKAMHLNYSGDYFTQAITHSFIKPLYTVSGTLPIALPTKPRCHSFDDWAIYGNADGVGVRTKNIADINGIDITQYGVRWYAENGYLRAVGKYNDNTAHTQPRFYYQLDAGSYVVSGSPDYTQTGVGFQIGTCTDAQGSNYIQLGSDIGAGFSFTLENASWIVIRMYTAKTLYNQDIDLTIPLMLRKAGTSSEFIPYGYQIPITVSQTGQTDKNYDIFVGDSPLTEGETVSQDTSKTHITVEPDLETTISTTLENKPEMKIIYN